MFGLFLIFVGLGTACFGFRLIFSFPPKWLDQLLWKDDTRLISIMSIGIITFVIGSVVTIFGSAVVFHR